MRIVSSRVTVTDTATLLSSTTDDVATYGHSVLVTNRHATDSIDLGGPDVTTGAGFELKAAESVSVDLEQGDVLYGIAAAAGSVTVHVLRTGV